MDGIRLRMRQVRATVAARATAYPAKLTGAETNAFTGRCVRSRAGNCPGYLDCTCDLPGRLAQLMAFGRSPTVPTRVQ